MRAVIQRVQEARVAVEGKVVGQIKKGILVYLGVEKGDTEKEIEFMAEKILNLRIFGDRENRMNLSISEINGDILSISQFTLASYIKKGRRPDFTNAMEPNQAREFYELFNRILSRRIKTATGIFGAKMEVSSINDGPVTFIIEYNGTMGTVHEK
jgi:D-tyrosyl-tRNA(Tyr) deacylase